VSVDDTKRVPTMEAPGLPGSPVLAPEVEFVVLLRALLRVGYEDAIAGHATVRQPDGTLCVNPHGFTWSEVGPDDVLRIDASGRVVAGRWAVTPAIELHLALHRARPGTNVAIHNHPRWGTTWAALRRVPPAYDQTSAGLEPIVLVDEYGGTVTEVTSAEAAVAAMGDASIALLASHGVFVLGDDLGTAFRRCRSLEYRARMAWQVEVAGGAETLDDAVGTQILAAIAGSGRPITWDAAVRRELRDDPGLLAGG
jgi:ribulose-5-phosphate 4-epimerase/fuculose-1-phosphate aldolase